MSLNEKVVLAVVASLVVVAATVAAIVMPAQRGEVPDDQSPRPVTEVIQAPVPAPRERVLELPVVPRQSRLEHITWESIRRDVEQEGWGVMGKPTVTDTAGVKATVVALVKGNMAGTVVLYSVQSQITTDAIEKGFTRTDTAVEREGNRVLAVTIPDHKAEATRLLDVILQSARRQ